MPQQADSTPDISRTEFEDLFLWDNCSLLESEEEQLKGVLWEYRDLFQAPGKELGYTHVLEHKVTLKTDSQPFRSAPYRSNPRIREEISKQVKDMSKKGIIRPSCSPYASPVVMVRKSDDTWRFCVDYRMLNLYTVPDSHPISRVDDSLESLGSSKATYFSTLDLQSGYWQIAMEEKSKPLTAFVTHDGLYEFERMPFGLRNAPSTFARLITSVLQGLVWKICLIYLDDIIVFSKDFEDHITRLKMVFDRLKAANLKLKPKKCVFGCRKVRFLGHLVSADGVEPLPDTCQVIQEFPVPTNLRELRSFLGITGYYRRFVKKYSERALPLTELTKLDVPFIWGQAQQESFQDLKNALVNPPILAYARYQDPYILYADASGEAAGMILSQVQEGKERVIAYAAKKFTDAEKKYSISELEALACILGVQHFEPYLKGNRFKIVTDHIALKWLFDQKKATGRIARWVAYLQQFEFTIEHRSGKKLSNVDGLSRQKFALPRLERDLEVIEEVILPPLWDNDESSNQGESCQTDNLYTEEQEIRGTLDRPIQQETLLFTNMRQKQSDDLGNDDILDVQEKPKENQLTEQPMAEAEPMLAKTKNPWVNCPKAPGDVKPDLTASELRKLQLADPYINSIFQYLEENILPSNSREARRLAITSQNYEIIEGVLYHIWYPDGLGTDGRLVLQMLIPRSLVFDVLTSSHGDVSAGHYGIWKTYHTLKLSYFWRGMMRDVINWIQSCHLCNATKKPTKPFRSGLQPLPCFRPGECWAMDILGPLKETYSGSKYILVFTS